MPRKKQQPQEGKAPKMRGYIAGAGEIVQQDISDTLRQNFMPYAMSVIMSRAIPEIDGFKPSHRKLLYTMYKMGLLGPTRTKSANIVGQTMKLNPHGDAAIYDTMVRLCTPTWIPRATSARPTPGIWPGPPPGTPRPSWRPSARSCSRISTRTPWTLWTTTTAP